MFKINEEFKRGFKLWRKMELHQWKTQSDSPRGCQGSRDVEKECD